MKINIKPRAEKKKGAINEIRRSGGIPAVLYTKTGPCQTIVISSTDFSTVLRGMKQGHLPTTVFTLVDGKKETRAIIKDIQRNITNYQVTHIDFEELVDNIPVSIKVPIICVGLAECIGVKLGGFLRQVIRYVKVECLPKDMPQEFAVNVKDLGIKQTKRLSDISMPKGVRPLASMDEVVVVVAKGKG